jgi:dolichol-phosphate mannosyltransferase
MFDEEAGAAACVNRVCGALRALPCRTRLVVVDDGSRDDTAAILREARGRLDALVVLSHERNRGYGAALATGAAWVVANGFAYVLFMDSDGTNDVADLARFAVRMGEGLDVVKASRYSPGGSVAGVPWARVLVSRVGNAVARLLFRLPIRDCTNGFRAVKADLRARMDLREPGFAVIMEELWWCSFLARTYGEVPVTLTDRRPGLRRTAFVYRPSVLWRYLRYALLAFAGVRPTGTGVPSQG